MRTNFIRINREKDFIFFFFVEFDALVYTSGFLNEEPFGNQFEVSCVFYAFSRLKTTFTVGLFDFRTTFSTVSTIWSIRSTEQSK